MVKQARKNQQYPYIIMGVVLIALAIINIVQIGGLASGVDQKIAEAKEEARPADISFFIINPNCDDCQGVEGIVQNLEGISSLNIKEKKTLDISSSQAQELIKSHQIKRLPALVVTGELEKSPSLKSRLADGLTETKNAYVYSNPAPPYYDVASKQVKGLVKATLIIPDNCPECNDMSILSTQLQQGGVVIAEEETIPQNQAGSLIAKYNLDKLPAYIFSKDISAYSTVTDVWSQVGKIADDGTYYITSLSAPYYDLQTNKIRGKTKVTYLVSESCQECYDPVLFHKRILDGIGVYIEDQQTVDISSEQGQDLIQTFDIKKVPTVIISGDAESYPQLQQVWTQVGTIEEHGELVFRSVEIAKQPYYDLENDKIVPAAGVQ